MHPEMTELARGFPSLRQAEGVEPWDPGRLDAWACAQDEQTRHAARFVLALFGGLGPGDGWRVGRFWLFSAMAAWDAKHRAAFAAWARKPTWP